MFWKIPLLLPLLLAALPATSNYQLNSYGFGSGGTSDSGTSNYSLEGISGEISSQPEATSNYTALPGFTQTQQANVPKVTLTNPSNYYDKLHFVIDQQSNPSDALYALQISTTSDFSSGINYVKSDNTIGPSLTLADYQTYTAWGGSSGANIIGLAANTTYYLRVKATQGQFTESAYGPAASAATVGQSLTFCLYTTSCGSGNSINFSGLVANNITNSPDNITVDFDTNADLGGNVYVYSANGGLASSSAGYTITSATADLSSAAEGFGAQILSVSQSSGGPFSKVSPYDGSGNNVGALGTTAATIFSSAAPLTGGSGSVQLQVKPSSTTPEATDYSETITFVAAAGF
jgi:hypothetical protein